MDVTTRGWLMSMPGSPLGSVPTQTTRWSYSRRSSPTRTAPSSTTPWPRTTRTLRRLQAASTPRRMVVTTSSLRSIIRGKSTSTSPTLSPSVPGPPDAPEQVGGREQ